MTPIHSALQDLERDRNIRILFAVESGSRAWGFASPDSDYDVRFVFVHPREKYLEIEEPEEHINLDLPGELDLVGWDIRKALKLGLKGNSGFFEWLNSPMVYWGETTRTEFRKLLLPYFRPKASTFHYLGIARSTENSGIEGQMISIKKYFYILRPVLAAYWVSKYMIPPPVEFGELLPLVEDKQVKKAIMELLQQKETAMEAEKIPLIPEIEEGLSFWKREVELVANKLGKELHKDPAALNKYFQSIFQ